MSERLIQYLYLTMRGLTYHHVRKYQHLYLTMGGLACHHVERAHHLHPTMGGLACYHAKKSLGLITSPWKEPRMILGANYSPMANFKGSQKKGGRIFILKCYYFI